MQCRLGMLNWISTRGLSKKHEEDSHVLQSSHNRRHDTLKTSTAPAKASVRTKQIVVRSETSGSSVLSSGCSYSFKGRTTLGKLPWGWAASVNIGSVEMLRGKGGLCQVWLRRRTQSIYNLYRVGQRQDRCSDCTGVQILPLVWRR